MKMLLESNNSMETFCNIADLNQYVVSDNSTDLGKLQSAICGHSINFPAIYVEVMSIGQSSIGNSLVSARSRPFRGTLF